MFPHTKVCTEKEHVLPSVCTLVQVSEVTLCEVLVGQLPQFDDVMKYCTVRQSKTNEFQLNVISDPCGVQSSIQLILRSGGKTTI